ncbi:hypothetical protein BIWAKO_05091 [Bosea sp. BIWAKO-01]|nr:hypothetical protein BIWAKO_05091 [Bosea sp. BIWAKO-01]
MIAADHRGAQGGVKLQASPLEALIAHDDAIIEIEPPADGVL